MIVIDFFKKISDIPRGSGNEKQISDWIQNFAKERGLFVTQDSVHNLIIKKPGTNGHENADTLILQGHMDMVCEKNVDTQHDFLKDPIRIITDGDILKADGTTLGADNGIAVAMALALLDSSDIPHPPLEVLLTADEEEGMLGAKALDGSLFSGRKLINLDSAEEGIFYVSCAGGLLIDLKLPTDYIELPEAHSAFSIRIRGLKGGHSGMDINKGRGNSNRLLGRVLHRICSELDAHVVSVNGGFKHNAIPRESEAIIAIRSDQQSKATEIVKSIDNVFRNELKIGDPDVEIEFEQAEKNTSRVFAKMAAQKVISVLCVAPLGVQDMSQDIPGLTEVSINMGVVRTDEDIVKITFCLRSSVASKKEALRIRIEQLAGLAGATYEVYGEYPEWEYNPNSALRHKLVELYERINGHKPKINAIHAGLECGLLAQKLPGVDIISFGPDITNAHSPDEYVSISSVERVWDFFTRALTEI